MKRSIVRFLSVGVLGLGTLGAAGPGAEQLQFVLIGLTLIFLCAKLGGNLAAKIHQPEVLGELIAGILVGNGALVGFEYLEFVKHDQVLLVLSELGVILLMFEVGLETNLSDMMKVGPSSFVAAVLGVVLPFAFGWGASAYFLPEKGAMVHAFIGAVLCATSVGITARVLKDAGKLQTKVGRIILGAAVIDDVLGLLVLAVMTGMVGAMNTGRELDLLALGKIISVSAGFLLGALVLGKLFVPLWFRYLSRLEKRNVLLTGGLSLCFLLAYLAALAGLAPIVGAFAAGLVIEPFHYADLAKREATRGLHDLIFPLTTALVPLFFVLTGTQVDLRAFANTEVIGFALVLTVVAILGKLACALGVLERGADRLAVGLGMIPRGEVGLIFASVGSSLTIGGDRVIDTATFSAVVVMVVLTTLVTPPLLQWRLKRS